MYNDLVLSSPADIIIDKLSRISKHHLECLEFHDYSEQQGKSDISSFLDCSALKSIVMRPHGISLESKETVLDGQQTV